MTNGKRRRLSYILLSLCLLLIVGIGVDMWQSLNVDRAIVYGDGSLNLPASPSTVCPGGSFTFPVSIAINHSQAVSRITEGWCRSDGICPHSLQQEPYYINFTVPYSVTATATRTVPLELSAGDWQLRHCNETHATGVIDVTCWSVDVEVQSCTP